jgi:hypothetical protein
MVQIMFTKRADQAIAECEQIEAGSGLALLCELEQAQAAVQAGLALGPSFTIRRYQIARSVSHDHPTVIAGRERGVEGMRWHECLRADHRFRL